MKRHRPSVDLLQAAVASAPIILWTADPEGVITLFEGRGVTELGLQPAQLVGTSLMDYFSGRPEMLFQLRRALAGEAIHFESEAKGKAFEHWVEPLRDASGASIGVVGATIDVTARNEARELHRQSEAQFRALAEGSVQGIVIHRDRQFLYANQAYADALGYANPDEVCALPSMDAVVAPEERERLRDLSRRRIRGEAVPESYEAVGISKQGARRDMLIFSRAIQWHGETAIQSTLQDITERKRTEAALQQSQRLLSAVFDAIPHATVVKDKDDRYLMVNKAWREYFGQSAEAVLGRRTSENTGRPSDEVKLFAEEDRQVLTGAVPLISVERDLTVKNGERRHVQAVKVPMFDARGEVTGLVGMSIDITDRQRAEEARAESQRLLSTVFDAIPHAIIVKDKQDRYLMVNKAWQRALGMAAEDVIGKQVADWGGRPPEETERVADENRQVLSGAVPQFIAERRMQTRYAGTRYVQVVKEPLRDASGEVMGLVSISMDMTERRRAEADLLEKEWMLSRAARAAQIGTWFRDYKTSALRWSEETYRILGVDPQAYDPTVSGYVPLIHPEDRAEYERERLRVDREGGTFRHEHRILRPDGEVRMVMVIGERYHDTAGNPVGVIGIFQDITNQRLSEARLVHSEKMEAVGRLTAGVAHDFNNLLTVIRGNLELLMRSVSDLSGVRPLVESVLTAAERGASLVRQLSTIALKQPLQPTVISVKPVIEGLTSLLERTLGSTIQVGTDIQPDTWNVRVDTAQLQSAILNLAINARDAMRNGGRLALSAANVTLDELDQRLNPDAAAGEYVMVAVSDTGTGIPEALRGKVFEPFFTTKEPGKGTGLGLSMVFGFVRQSGGHVRLESEINRGTTVRLYFPRAPLG